MTLISRIKQLFRHVEHAAPVVLSELGKINLQIDTAAKNISRVDSSRHAGTLRCKASDDLHFNKIEELKQILTELKTTRSKMYIDLFNTFELNTPCTIEYVMHKVGLPYIAESEMIEKLDFINEYDEPLYENHVVANMSKTSRENTVFHTTEIDFISSTELKITKYTAYSVHQNKCRMKLPNWRFVQSKDSSIHYVERYEPQK